MVKTCAPNRCCLRARTEIFNYRDPHFSTLSGYFRRVWMTSYYGEGCSHRPQQTNRVRHSSYVTMTKIDPSRVEQSLKSRRIRQDRQLLQKTDLWPRVQLCACLLWTHESVSLSD